MVQLCCMRYAYNKSLGYELFRVNQTYNLLVKVVYDMKNVVVI